MCVRVLLKSCNKSNWVLIITAHFENMPMIHLKENDYVIICTILQWFIVYLHACHCPDLITLKEQSTRLMQMHTCIHIPMSRVCRGIVCFVVNPLMYDRPCARVCVCAQVSNLILSLTLSTDGFTHTDIHTPYCAAWIERSAWNHTSWPHGGISKI